MLQNNLKIIEAVLDSDPTVSQVVKKAVIEMAKHGLKTHNQKDRILSRKEVAEIFGVTTKSIDNWRARGVLKPLVIPGNQKCLGYRESDVDALIAGRMEARPADTESEGGCSHD